MQPVEGTGATLYFYYSWDNLIATQLQLIMLPPDSVGNRQFTLKIIR